MFAAYQEFATDRYERRLNQDIAGLRLELHDGLAGIRQELSHTRADLMKWTLLLWLSQFAALTAVLIVHAPRALARFPFAVARVLGPRFGPWSVQWSRVLGPQRG